jgi:transcriptional regulator with XRE-family HTH domain|tara:strand:+ start:12378 stop:13226 length:849 start_codon:yes stop_codon:yes gene_type:complete
MNRTEVVALFRERLLEIIERSGLSRSAFAQKIQLDRSTLSQLLSAENERLARAETILAIATEGAVSIDWLLGRSQEEGQGAALVANAMQIEPGADVPVDERLQRWHAEAAGYKIRYVPASLPDLLKTQDVIDFEYGTRSSDTAQNRWEETEARLAYSRLPETDMEVCTTFQSIEAFAAGGGIWDGLSEEARAGQLDHMIRLVDELYPTFRWFLYDGRKRFSVPLSIFGLQRAALYVGDMYFVFNATDQVRVLTQHFDGLVRSASIQPTEVIAVLRKLRNGMA